MDFTPILVVLGLVAFAFALPAKWDPAILLKEFNLRWERRLEDRDDGNEH